MKMIMKKVISAMAIVGMLGTSGAVMAAANNTNQDAAANNAKAPVETCVQEQAGEKSMAQNMYQYQNMNNDKGQNQNENGTQAQKQNGDCDQTQKQLCDGECDQTQAQTQQQNCDGDSDQTQLQTQAGRNN
jgi:hypothetical protein